MAWASVGRAREGTTVVDWGLEGVGKWAWTGCHGCGWGMGVASLSWVWVGRGRGQTAAATHLLQLQPHFVEGAQPVGLGSRHGVLTLLAFLVFSWPETEARGFVMLQGRHSLHPPLSK